MNKEEEKVIQPRDDSGDQIMEEEKNLNNDLMLLIYSMKKKRLEV